MGHIPSTDARSGEDLALSTAEYSGEASGVAGEPAANVAEIDLYRASLYAAISRLLAKPMDAETMSFVRTLEGDETDIGQALAGLSALAARTTETAAADEYTVLFYGHGAGGELSPYASTYLTGFSYDKPLADLRGDLSQLGVTRSDDVREPEDHVAFLAEIMHGLIMGGFGVPSDAEAQKQFFQAHIEPWAIKFFKDMERAKSAAFYMPVATLGRVFFEIEAEQFRLGVE